MSATIPEFNRGAVRPMECLRGGWDLIKGQYWLFLGIALVALFLGSAVPLGILMGPMMCGLYLALFRRQRGERATFDLLFKGFDYFKESVIATLIQVVPMLLILLPTYVISFAVFFTAFKPGRRGQPPDIFPIFAFMTIIFLVVMILSIAIGILFAFTFPLIVDRRLSGVDAVKTSIKAAMANLGGMLGLMLMMMLLSFIGLLLCYVGAFLMLPIHFAAWAVAYRQVFSFTNEMPPAPPGF
ncbi:MAG TPA: hypothetical protein VF543_16420 [Pyrinomonadaceae bacterium]